MPPPTSRVDGTARAFGHSHFWERAASRRTFIKTAAGAAGGVALGAALHGRGRAEAKTPSADPRPIPNGIQPFGDGTEVFHLFLPVPGAEPSSIFDFNGLVGVCQVQGEGAGRDATGSERLLFDADLRFMKGTYVGMDGRHHRGTFGFV